MSGSNSALVRPIAWVLLVALIGVYLLYDWYSGQLSAQLDQKDVRIAEADARIKDREARIVPLESEIAALQERIRELTDLHSGERRQLQELISAAEQDKAALREAIETLRQTDASVLAEEQAKTAAALEERDRGIAAYQELQVQYDAALANAESLKKDLTGLQRVIAESTAEHREQIELLERHLNERVSLAKATPKDEELMRAAQAAGLLPAAPGGGEDTRALTARLAEAQDALHTLQAESDAARSAHEMQLSALEGELKEARTALAEQSQQAPSADAVTQMQERLALAEAELAKVKADAATLQEAGTASADQLADAETRIAALAEQLAREQVAKATVANEKENTAAELEAELARAKTELADLRAELGAVSAAAEDIGEKAVAEARSRIAILEKAIEEERTASERLQSAAREEAAAAVAGLRDLYRRFSELGGTHTDRGMLLKLADTELRFQPGMATLPNDDLPSLDRIAGLLAEHPDLRIRIEGHTDSSGDEETNLALSLQRAEAVKQALVERGVDSARLSAEGLGPARAIADNTTPTGRAQNRRVEVYVIEG
ncbi:OmpA family protein [Thiocapsa rosea]|uniref:OmpA family protein n=1 Tax=Thiocapsa rosea TaxID=69360 RepID=A0A495V7H7_9GAMM|nr:OmpA family protein [Thiocapsa rosea]RKT43718.1 OmpA family protein [Thiocapsa rosea]